MNLRLAIGFLSVASGLIIGCAQAPRKDCCRVDSKPTNDASRALAAPTDKSLYQVSSYWTTDTGKQIPLSAIGGKPQVVVFFFSTCQFTCPIIINDLKRIAAGLPENLGSNVGFTLISFDSERDTPKVLHAVRQERGLAGDNWTLLRGEPDDVRELATLLHVNYRQDASGQFAHSNVITVLNAGGEIVMQQTGFNLPPDSIITKLEALSTR